MLSIAVVYAIAAILAWLLYHIVRQNGRMLLRIEQLERQIRGDARSRPSGLKPGTQAPEFRLPGLDGGELASSSFAGQKTLLVFFDPECGFCQQLAPQLARLTQAKAPGQPALALISTGDAALNRAFFAKHPLTAAVGLQSGKEVSILYGTSGTPMGYLIDERGVVASELLIGATALLAAASGSAPAPELRGRKPLSASRINRDGLPAGATAPPFRLPRIGGGELSLTDYRGRSVLLVFSDPHCAPCEQAAHHLEHYRRGGGRLEILMISRGSREENEAKVRKLGLSFPVALQEQWEISRAYGMFATPIAFLIDSHGMIARNVAVGADAIVGLLNEPVATAS